MMRVVEYDTYGPPDVLKIRERPKPVLKANEVLVRIITTTVSSADCRLRGFKVNPLMRIPMGLYLGVFHPKRKILGFAFSGIIEEIGKNVTLYSKGDEVFGSAGLKGGTYAEYINLPETASMTIKPGVMSHEQATCIPFGPITSLYFLRKGEIQIDDKVLIYGASGSLGTAAIQIAKHYGAKGTGVCSSSNIELLSSLGADKILDYTKGEFLNHAEKYDIIFDTVGKSPFSKCIELLKNEGKYIRAVHMELVPLIRGLWVNLTSKKRVIGGVSSDLKEDLIYLKDLFLKGKFAPVIDKTYPIAHIVEAHTYVDKGHKKGNVVVKVTLQE